MSYSDQQFWRPDPQAWAVQQERMRHTQALFGFGEYAIFVLMWQIHDHKAGLVERCPLCWKAFDKIAAAYGQSAQAKCPNCFGTTFEGGYRAIIVRPAIWTQSEEDVNSTRTGEATTATANVQSTDDFNMNTGDYIFRANATRWQCNGPAADTEYLHTGFQYANSDQQAVGFNYQRVSRSDESTVAYLIPPDALTLTEILSSKNGHAPTDFSDVEVIRGPLR